ncbi:HypC/HybG/HupF family hydrogenase formation chaperone [Patescibacteria group bacterium]|nr:HypC/HybG/HupF family hydrogenase formation chaperone [Patescibacteria group bacterium]MBU4000314.1 HypC/HybG/HupF family hydrogenase formation chaperone [Patescibacteria group bacterium]MBU4056919.1 HypC/HybG/HupF family hydrogenase formation chaperone [Patescibacteria group bacterium]MBU4368445.1 HypC/HybG/HupF family hydrogenase formation chaperone [Patescibacteria group bacterium]
MCLAVPGKIKSINLKTLRAKVDFNGMEKEVNCELVKVKKGDYVVVHAGFAIQKLEQREAKKTLALFNKSAKIKK